MAEPKFIPKDGQIDFTNIRYCPVINIIVRYKNKILVVQRSQELRLYPSYWNGVSGFLDDNQKISQKVYEELQEEVNIAPRDVTGIKIGSIFMQDSEKYKKTWIVFPVLADVKTDKIALDREATRYRWLTPKEVAELNLLPGFIDVVKEFFPKTIIENS